MHDANMVERRNEAADRDDSRCINGRNESVAKKNAVPQEENESEEAHEVSHSSGQGTHGQDNDPVEEESQISIPLAYSSENGESTAEPTAIDEQTRMKECSFADTPSSSKKKKKPYFSQALLRSLPFIDHTQIAYVPPVSTSF